jgi:predicted permease
VRLVAHDLLETVSMDAWLHDLRLALRGIRRNPGFTAATVLTLALGLGATTAVFSVVYSVMVRPLPFPNAGRLVRIVQVLPPRPGSASAEPTRAGLTGEQVRVLDERSRTLQHVGRHTAAAATVTGAAFPVRLSGVSVTVGLFDGLGVPPQLGRLFTTEDERSGAERVVILSDATWRQYFGADPAVTTRRVLFNRTPTRIVGVMPETFGFPSLASAGMTRNSAGVLSALPEYWAPLLASDDLSPSEGVSWYPTLALMRPGVTLPQALAETRELVPALPVGERSGLELVTAKDELVRDVSRALTLFQGGVGLILLMACANVMNLLLARAAYRRRELLVRRALGASVGALLRASVTEGVCLAILGGVVGIAVAYRLTGALRTLPPHVLPRLEEVHVDGMAIAFGLALSIVSGVVVGLVSTLRNRRAVATNPSHLSGAHGSIAPAFAGPSRAIVVGQVAVVIVLLTASGLLINSFARLARLNPGMDPRGVLAFRLTLPPERYPAIAAQELFYAELSARLMALGSVRSVGATNFDLQGMFIMFGQLVVDGRAADANSEVSFRLVTPGFFRTLGIPLEAGREFRADDRTPRAGTVVVNEAFARRYLPEGALGHTISLGRRWPGLRVIGVASDVRETLTEAAVPTLFLPPGDVGPNFETFATFVRASGSARELLPGVRRIVADLDPNLAVYNAFPLEEFTALATASSRLYGLVALACSVLALGLGGIGVYGLLSFFVGRRTQEIGVRLALGADARVLARRIVGRGLTLTAIGTVIGLGAALYISQFLRSLIFEARPSDVAAAPVAAAVFAIIAAVASYLPARRALRIDPATTLRAE